MLHINHFFENVQKPSIPENCFLCNFWHLRYAPLKKMTFLSTKIFWPLLKYGPTKLVYSCATKKKILRKLWILTYFANVLWYAKEIRISPWAMGIKWIQPKKLQKFSLTIFITIYRPQGEIFCRPFQLSRDVVIKLVHTPHACTYPCKSAGRLIVKPTIEMFSQEMVKGRL